MSDSKKQPSQRERELIIERLEVLSPELCFASGASFENFSRDEMIKQIEDNTEIGKKFVETELEFLRAVKDGSLMRALTTNDQ